MTEKERTDLHNIGRRLKAISDELIELKKTIEGSAIEQAALSAVLRFGVDRFVGADRHKGMPKSQRQSLQMQASPFICQTSSTFQASFESSPTTHPPYLAETSRSAVLAFIHLVPRAFQLKLVHGNLEVEKLRMFDPLLVPTA